MASPALVPADYTEMLEVVASDPLFQQFLKEGDHLEQRRKAVLAFTQRCDYIYACVHNEAKSAFRAYPQTALTDLVLESVKERLIHWHLIRSYEVPESYCRAYQAIPLHTEAAEQVVMQPWHRRGFQQGAMDAVATQHQA